MKTKTTFFFFLFIATMLNAQVPGGDFENWKSLTFESPTNANLTNYDEDPSPESAGMLEKSSDASDGNYAIKFNLLGGYDFGYVVYGQVEDGPSGGIPFADNPTQVTISY